MKIVLEPGCYVVAVSGGIDSMVLLDMVVQRLLQVRLVVAHFDHGIRPDASQDRQLVQQIAARQGLQFVYDEGRLGANASEAVARQARYDFLHRVRAAAGAQAILTAHHSDDVVETAIINMIRGTGRKGLSSLGNQAYVLQPLKSYRKQELQIYATQRQLEWREDSTNQDSKYLRNHIRQKIVNKLSNEQYNALLESINKAKVLNDKIDALIGAQLHQQVATDKLDRSWFIGLPYAVAREVIAGWLRNHSLAFDSRTVQRLVVAAKTLSPGKRTNVSGQVHMSITKRYLALEGLDR